MWVDEVTETTGTNYIVNGNAKDSARLLGAGKLRRSPMMAGAQLL
jgi:hypothetical protein